MIETLVYLGLFIAFENSYQSWSKSKNSQHWSVRSNLSWFTLYIRLEWSSWCGLYIAIVLMRKYMAQEDQIISSTHSFIYILKGITKYMQQFWYTVADSGKGIRVCPQGCLFFKKIWIIPQHYTSSDKILPQILPQLQSYWHLLTRGIDPSLNFFSLFTICGVSQSQMLTWMYGEGDVPPSEAGNFSIFETGIMQFGEYFWAQ